MTQPPFRLPTPGSLTDALDDIDPGARPQPARPRKPNTGRHQIPVARRSPSRLAPGDRYFYWCAYCNYCNTPEEGRQALCPNHRLQGQTERKARARGASQHVAGTGGQRGRDEITDEELSSLMVKAQALHSARLRHEGAMHAGNSKRAFRNLDAAILDLLGLIQSLRDSRRR